MIRLDKFIANNGYGSRKEVNKLIRKNSVSVNGEIVDKPTMHIDIKKDKVCVNGVEVLYTEFVYLMM